MITQIEPQELESIISGYEKVKSDVAVKATPFAIPEGQKFTIQLTRGSGLSLHTEEDEEVSENLQEWFQKANNHLFIQVLKLDPISLEIPVERPVLEVHCVWDETNKIAYFYLTSISTSLYDTVFIKRETTPSPLENPWLNLIDVSDYASIRIGEVTSTLSENGEAYLKKELESSSETFISTKPLRCQSVLWKLDINNCGDVDTHFVEYRK